MNECLKAINTNLDIITASESAISKRKSGSPSFFMGDTGIYVMGALFYKQIGDIEKMKECFAGVLECGKMCGGKNAEDEVLYGNAGYLYALLRLYLSDKEGFDCREMILKVVGELKKEGLRNNKKGMLSYTFPRRKGKFYLGGAHGLIGILYMLMRAVQILPELKEDGGLMKALEASCVFMAELQYHSGNFPSSYGSTSDRLVHFCHGANGAIPFLIECHKLFQDESYLIRAEKAAKCIWQRGILKKGNGLCHGITGNAYHFLSLYVHFFPL